MKLIICLLINNNSSIYLINTILKYKKKMCFLKIISEDYIKYFFFVYMSLILYIHQFDFYHCNRASIFYSFYYILQTVYNRHHYQIYFL